MRLFRDKTRATLEGAEADAVTRAPWSLWADALGRAATRGVQLVIVVGIAIGILFVLRELTLVTIPLVLALIIASALAPVMRRMRARGIPASVATGISLFAITVVFGAVAWLIVVAVRDEWDDLFAQAQDGFREFTIWAQDLPFFPTAAQLEELLDQVTHFITSAQFGSGAVAGVGAVANFVASAVLFLTMLFFFLKDGPMLWEFLLRPFVGEQYARARRIGDKTVEVLGSYLRGTAAVSLVDAVGILIGLLILQVPLAVPLAVVVFVFAFVPIVGATTAGIIAALVALVANGWVNALMVLGVVLIVNQLENYLLQPVLMGRSMKLHALVIIVALTIGGAVGGIIGAILAVPVTAAVWGIIKVWDGDDLAAEWARPKPGRETAL